MSYGETEYFMNAFQQIMQVSGWSSLLSIAAAVLVAFAVYYDAMSRGNPKATMWAVLTGLLGWIPGIIYLVTRNNAAKRLMQCQSCGAVHPVGFPTCPRCSVPNPYAAPFCANPLQETQRRRALVLFIIYVVLEVISMAIMIYFLTQIFGMMSEIPYYGY